MKLLWRDLSYETRLMRKENWSEYKRNFSLKPPEKRHFNNINAKDVTENKQFWEAIKPFFTAKAKTTNDTILTENETVREDKTICQFFNNYSTNVNTGLKFRQVDESQSFENEESCSLIKENYSAESFSLKSISRYYWSSQKITFKQNINIKWRASFSNTEFCYLLLWKACKYF